MKYDLTGIDGNAFNVMGYTAKALRMEGLWEEAEKMYREATRGDYDNLVQVCMKYIDMANEAAEGKDE